MISGLVPVEPFTRKAEKWVVHFKAHASRKCPGCGYRELMPVIPMPKLFGWADSQEAALARVEQKIQGDPIWAMAWWRAHGRGRFYAVPVADYVEMPDMSAVAQRIEVGR